MTDDQLLYLDQIQKLLIPIWRGIGADYKRKYSMSIWQQFQSQIASAAHTNTLSRFYNTICKKLNVVVRKQYTEQIVEVLSCGHDREVLRIMRDETTLCVLLVRVENEKRQNEWRKQIEEEI